MQRYVLAFSSMMLFLAAPCQRLSTPEVAVQPMHQNCALKPEAGPCRMAIKRYYYDAETKTCKEFLYGGCQGVVPFETLVACRKGCGCE